MNQLRWCGECVHDELEALGFATWRIDHQLPCTWVCAKHKRNLTATDLPGAASWLSRWMLPDALAPMPTGQASKPPAEFLLVASAACRLSELARVEYFGRERLEAILQAQPWEAKDRLVNLVQLANSHFAPRPTLGRQLKSAIACADPNYLPLFAVGLFGDADSLVEAYHSHQSNGASRTGTRSNARAVVVRLVTQGATPSRAARTVGVDVKTAQIWVAQDLKAVHRRPKKVRGDREASARSFLKLGADKALITHTLEISEPALNTFLATHPVLQREWRTVRHDRAISMAKCQLEMLAAGHPQVSAKVCRMLEPAAYAHLYRNDRTWLLSFTQHRPSPPPRHDQIARWDSVLARTVDDAKMSIKRACSGADIAAIDLLAQLPSVAGWIQFLAAMPLTALRLSEIRRSCLSKQSELF